MRTSLDYDHTQVATLGVIVPHNTNDGTGELTLGFSQFSGLAITVTNIIQTEDLTSMFFPGWRCLPNGPSQDIAIVAT